MKTYCTLLLTLVASLEVQSAIAQAAKPTLQIVTIFNIGGDTYGPDVEGINSRSDVVGNFQNVPAGTTEGLLRTFDRKLVRLNFPGATATYAQDINRHETICGFYSDTSDATHGWFLSDGTYSSFDVEGATVTQVEGMNDAGDFVGLYITSGGLPQAFLDIGGTVSTLDVGGVNTYATAISSDGAVVGNYRQTTHSVYRGFLRMADGTLVRNISYPHSFVPGTFCSGINKHGWVVGNYWGQFTGYGFLFKAPNTYISYGVQGADSTYLTGINDSGRVSGYYVDNDGIAHGLILQIVNQ